MTNIKMEFLKKMTNKAQGQPKKNCGLKWKFLKAIFYSNNIEFIFYNIIFFILKILLILTI